MIRWIRVAVLVALAARPAHLAAQQALPAAVRGTVRDSVTATPVPDATVSVDAGPAVLTDTGGRYLLTGLEPRTTLIHVQRLGYRAATRTVALSPGDTAQLDFALAPASLELAPVIVTAGKRSQLLDQAVTSVALVTPTDIARRGVTGVDEAVDKAPGVQFLGGQVNIRGSSGFQIGIGSRVLLLMDGVPANQGDRGGIDWDLVPLDAIDRVEIVKGAGSSLYGSAALGGVVNLITSDIPTGFHARLRATGGGFSNPPDTVWRFRDYTGGEELMAVTGSYGGDALRGSVTAVGHHTDGYREQDRGHTWQVAGKGEWLASPSTSLRAEGTWASHEYEVPVVWCEYGACDDRGLAYQPFKIDTARSLGAYTTSNKSLFAATLNHESSQRFSWMGRGSWLHSDFNDIRAPTGEAGVSDRYGGEVRAVARSNGDRVSTVGGELARSEISGDAFGDHTMTELAGYGEGEQRFGQMRLTAGARVDYVQRDGGGGTALVSPRVGMVVAGRVTWRASAGRAFRSPSFAELYPTSCLPGGVCAKANPDLEPETAWSFELGAAATPARGTRIDGALFWTEAEQYIEPAVSSSGLEIQFQNLQRARLAGLDVSATASALSDRLTTSLAYTFLYARELAHDTVPEPPLAFRPKHLLTLGADYTLGAFSVGADFRYMYRYDRVELYSPAIPLLSPKVLDARATVTRGAFEARLLVANALNYIYNLVPQTLVPVRTATVSVVWIH